MKFFDTNVSFLATFCIQTRGNSAGKTNKTKEFCNVSRNGNQQIEGVCFTQIG